MDSNKQQPQEQSLMEAATAVIDTVKQNNIAGNRDIIMANEDSGEKGDNSAIIDSLPYIDTIHDDYDQYALALIEDEMKQNTAVVRPPHLLLKETPLNTRSILLKNAIKCIADCTPEERQTIVGHDSRTLSDRYNNENENTTTSRSVKRPSENDSVQVWQEAIKMARILYETERLRAMNLELEKQESVSFWNDYIQTIVVPQHTNAKLQLESQRKNVERINHLRQQQQQEVFGRQLNLLTVQYEELVKKQGQLKQAVAVLEVGKKQNQRGALK